MKNDTPTSSESKHAFNPVLNRFVKIDPTQIWFWNSEWLKDELKVEEELRIGDFEEFDNM